MDEPIQPNDVLLRAESLRRSLSAGFRDEMIKSLYTEAERIAQRAVHSPAERRRDFDQWVDRIVTSPIFGLPLMLVLLAAVFWVTIIGANVPSQMIAKGLFWFEEQAAALFTGWGIPWWITGFIWHGVYRGLACC